MARISSLVHPDGRPRFPEREWQCGICDAWVSTKYLRCTHAAPGREPMVFERQTDTPTRPLGGRACRACEFWDAGGERARATALTGDCRNPNGDRFTPEADHGCPAWAADTTAIQQ